MNILVAAYNEVLWRPLFNGLVWFYGVLPWHDFGLAVIALTIAIRIVLTPLLLKSQRSQRNLAALQPEIKELQERYKNNKEAQGKALMELYASRKTNPFSGCLLMLVQLPILIALFGVFQKGLDPANLSFLYSFVPNPGTLNPVSFGLVDLSRGNLILGVIAALTQYFQSKIASASMPQQGGDMGRMLRWQTLYLFPAIIVIWSSRLPSALTLYWTVLNILGILQEIITRHEPRSSPKGD